MNVHYTARQMQMAPDVRQYCEKRFKPLEKLLSFATGVDVILSAGKNSQKAEIHIKAKGAGLVVVEESHDMLNSLNLAFDSLEKKIKKEREKYREKKRRGSRERKIFALPAEAVEREGRIVRTDYFTAKPLTLEDAVIQFNLNKREVFMFRRAGEEKWAVLFRRKDGNYGLVEPE
jgi:ribosome hibernation promoting factor